MRSEIIRSNISYLARNEVEKVSWGKEWYIL